jgi:hypothetical protein
MENSHDTHQFKDYEMNHTNGKKEIFSACCKCGELEVSKGYMNVCSEKMHKNSSVILLNMKEIKN